MRSIIGASGRLNENLRIGFIFLAQWRFEFLKNTLAGARATVGWSLGDPRCASSRSPGGQISPWAVKRLDSGCGPWHSDGLILVESRAGRSPIVSPLPAPTDRNDTWESAGLVSAVRRPGQAPVVSIRDPTARPGPGLPGDPPSGRRRRGGGDRPDVGGGLGVEDAFGYLRSELERLDTDSFIARKVISACAHIVLEGGAAPLVRVRMERPAGGESPECRRRNARKCDRSRTHGCDPGGGSVGHAGVGGCQEPDRQGGSGCGCGRVAGPGDGPGCGGRAGLGRGAGGGPGRRAATGSAAGMTAPPPRAMISAPDRDFWSPSDPLDTGTSIRRPTSARRKHAVVRQGRRVVRQSVRQDIWRSLRGVGVLLDERAGPSGGGPPQWSPPRVDRSRRADGPDTICPPPLPPSWRPTQPRPGDRRRGVRHPGPARPAATSWGTPGASSGTITHDSKDGGRHAASIGRRRPRPPAARDPLLAMIPGMAARGRSPATGARAISGGCIPRPPGRPGPVSCQPDSSTRAAGGDRRWAGLRSDRRATASP
jgi:hypothetical protein